MACIQGLKTLGRKSETTAIVAIVLFQDLEDYLRPSSRSMVDGHTEGQCALFRDICDLVSLENENSY